MSSQNQIHIQIQSDFLSLYLEDMMQCQTPSRSTARSALFCSVLFSSTLFSSTLFCSVLVSALFSSTLFSADLI
jgi:hypothetical protein